MRILVGILAHQLQAETVKSVFTQQWDDPDGLDTMFVWGQDIRPDETRFAAVTRKYQYLRDVFLAGPWDALLTVEQDMLLPPDALMRLRGIVEQGADIAYALYVWRYDGHHWWNAHPLLTLANHEHRWASMSHLPDQARRLWGQCVRVSGLGLGCTLLPRSTVERLPFRQIQHDHSCDTVLALDAQAAGLTQIADLGCVCGHRMDDHRVIWPDPNEPDLYRIEER